MLPSVLITQCLQNDFVQPIKQFDPLPNSLHIGHNEAQRLMGDNPLEGPIQHVINWAYKTPDEKLRLIHIRDWHDASDPSQASHLQQFGTHCLKGEKGSEFVFREPKISQKQVTVINSLTLNDFEETKLLEILNPYKDKKIRIGLMGVWTEAKITFLAYELITRFSEFRVGICSALTASSSRAHHFMALDQLKRILGIEIYTSIGQFIQFLGGDQAVVELPLQVNEDHPTIEFEHSQQLSEIDRKLLRYLFRDCRKVQLKCLDGGFSGNVVLGSQSEDLYGHKQVPHVIKIGRQDLIGQERAAFEKVESVLGNNAPHIAGFADFRNRGGIKYRYASMGSGFSTTFQKLYCQGLSEEKIKKFLKAIFVEQLGRFYQAATLEHVNLLEYYQYSLPNLANHMRPRIEAVYGRPATEETFRFLNGHETPNLYFFYEKKLPKLLPLAEGSAYMSYVHGDLNGANIIIDGQENVWLIDFFHTHRGHVLKDLIKFENDLLYIFTPIENEEDFFEAQQFSEQLLTVEDLSKSLPDFSQNFSSLHLRRAYETISILRSFYSKILDVMRDPLQFWIGQLRYCAHTLSFQESSDWQKKWALYTGSLCTVKIVEGLERTGPLRIDWLDSKYTGQGRLGITILPGRKDYLRDLPVDIEALKSQAISHVVCLLPVVELRNYGVPQLLDEYRKVGFIVKNMSVMDQRVSSQKEMHELICWMIDALAQGARIVVHCVGGLGRSGMSVACYLKSQGLLTTDAIAEVRKIRGNRAIETSIQEEFVQTFE